MICRSVHRVRGLKFDQKDRAMLRDLGVQPVPKSKANMEARATANSKHHNKRFIGISRPDQTLCERGQSGK